MDEIKIAKMIKSKREEKQLMQEDLSKVLGVTPSAISGWERGRTEPNMGQIAKMCELFGCSINELVYGHEAPQVDYTVSLSHDEKILIELFRRADDDSRIKAERELMDSIMRKAGD